MGFLSTIAAAASGIRGGLGLGGAALPPPLAEPLLPGSSPPVLPGALPGAAPAAIPDQAEAGPVAETGAAPSVEVVLPRLSRPLEPVLAARLTDAAAAQGASAERADTLGRVASLIAPADQPAPPLADQLARLASACRTLAERPADDRAAERTLLSQADAFATLVRNLGEANDALGVTLEQRVAALTQRLNQSLAAIHQANRQIITLVAQNRTIDAVLENRSLLIAEVVELTGARTFPRDHGAIALYTPEGDALLDDMLVLLLPGGPGLRRAGNQSPLNLRSGRLGALLRLAWDGSRAVPPRKPERDLHAEISRQLRLQLDELSVILARPAPAGAPPTLADQYDQAPTADGELARGLFIGGNRLSLALSPALADGSARLKRAALPLLSQALDPTRPLATTRSPPPPTVGQLVTAFTGRWGGAADAARREQAVAAAARHSMERRYRLVERPSANEEVAVLQGLQTARAAACRLSRLSADLAQSLAQAPAQLQAQATVASAPA